MKKRQIKKNSKKIADKLTGYASAVKELEALGVFSIDPNWRGDIECHMRPENIVKLPFAKSVGFKFSEFDKDHIQASVKFSGFTFFRDLGILKRGVNWLEDQYREETKEK
ncbi:hypothetical protein KWN52_000301 [Enterococcus hirae]|nr:hypothetical protein [Enterococcus hirae]